MLHSFWIARDIALAASLLGGAFIIVFVPAYRLRLICLLVASIVVGLCFRFLSPAPREPIEAIILAALVPTIVLTPGPVVDRIKRRIWKLLTM